MEMEMVHQINANDGKNKEQHVEQQQKRALIVKGCHGKSSIQWHNIW